MRPARSLQDIKWKEILTIAKVYKRQPFNIFVQYTNTSQP